MDHCTTPKTRTNTHMFWACFLTTEIIILMVKLQLQTNLSTIFGQRIHSVAGCWSTLTWCDDGGRGVVGGHGEVDDGLALDVDVDAGGADVRLLPVEHADAARPGAVAQGEAAAALGRQGVHLQVVHLGNLEELVLR